MNEWIGLALNLARHYLQRLLLKKTFTYSLYHLESIYWYPCLSVYSQGGTDRLLRPCALKPVTLEHANNGFITSVSCELLQCFHHLLQPIKQIYHFLHLFLRPVILKWKHLYQFWKCCVSIASQTAMYTVESSETVVSPSPTLLQQ